MSDSTTTQASMSAGPTISVVIPCYNAAPYLRETIDSVLAQTYPPLEVIVVDDGSTDDSAAIAESYGPPVRVIRQKNQGESVARNRAIDEARGEWIALLDADDCWEPTKLQRQAETVAAQPTLACVYTDFYYFDTRGRGEIERRPEYDTYPDFRVQMLCDWCVVPATSLVRTDLARQVRFPEWTKDAEDMMFFVDLREHGEFRHLPEVLAGKRRFHAQQTMLSDHPLRSAKSRYQWLNMHLDRFQPHEVQAVRRSLVGSIAHCYDKAFVRGDTVLVERCRALQREIDPQQEFPYPSQRRQLYLRGRRFRTKYLGPLKRRLLAMFGFPSQVRTP